MSRRTGSRGKGNGDNSFGKPLKTSRNTHEKNLQIVIEGLKDIPDDELQEFLDDEDFMQGLNVVDTWEGEEEEQHHSQYNVSSHNLKDRDSRRLSRDRNRRDHRGKNINNRNQHSKSKRDDRKREELRRDPSKSSKDIERDKQRTKRDNEIKILAEKEKAIKHLLDSDTVVPPGTEVEAIENEKNMMDRNEQHRSKKGKHFQKSIDRHRISPLIPNRKQAQDRIKANPFIISPDRIRQDRSPYISPERNRSIDHHRRMSWERRGSRDRRSRSTDRHRKRLEEREQKFGGRRSRSRERMRSRSIDRSRRRWSRSRSSGRRNRRSHSKSMEHRRKRSPFINEIARQFRDEPLLPTPTNQDFMQHQGMQPQRMPLQPLLNVPIQMAGPSGPPPQHYPPTDMLGPPQYMTYETHQIQQQVLPPIPQPLMSMNFDPVPMVQQPVQQPDYSAGPLLYNQPNPVAVHPQIRTGFTPIPIRSPQPVPAPGPAMDQSSMMFNPMHPGPTPQPNHPEMGGLHQSYPEQQVPMEFTQEPKPSNRGRLKTPEPPVISNVKKIEKTSLSSLLEASVSAKDSSAPTSFSGIKPDILRRCEMALHDLPDDDPRLKVKGRFFFDPTKEEKNDDDLKSKSNSILLKRNNFKLVWDDKNKNSNGGKIEYHQKSCQTDIINSFDTKGTQTVLDTCDFCIQTCPGDLQPSPIPSPPPREEKRPIMDRLDWNVRETFDFDNTIRESDDLRWSLNNSSQKRGWNRPVSPRDIRNPPEPAINDLLDYSGSPIRNRNNFSLHHSTSRNSYSPPQRSFSPDFRSRQSDYRDTMNRDQRSREITPLMSINHLNDMDDIDHRNSNNDNNEDDEVVILETDYSREVNWQGRGKSNTRKSRPRSSGRSFRGRGGYRGKF